MKHRRITLTLAAIAAAATFSTVGATPGTTAQGGTCTQTYTVRAGDTLGRIARQHGTTVSQLTALNGLSNPNRIEVGQTLCLASNNTGAVGQTYTVRRGDTLSRIARQFGISMKVLAEVNGIRDANKIYVGQVLTIPDFTIQS